MELSNYLQEASLIDLDKLRQLISETPDINQPSSERLLGHDGVTALHLAIHRIGHYGEPQWEMVRLLLQAGANPYQMTTDADCMDSFEFLIDFLAHHPHASENSWLNTYEEMAKQYAGIRPKLTDSQVEQMINRLKILKSRFRVCCDAKIPPSHDKDSFELFYSLACDNAEEQESCRWRLKHKIKIVEDNGFIISDQYYPETVQEYSSEPFNWSGLAPIHHRWDPIPMMRWL